MRFCFTKSEVTFAPIGYPHRKPEIIAKLPSSETEKIRVKRGPKSFTIRYIEFVCIKSDVRMKKGSREGNTI